MLLYENDDIVPITESSDTLEEMADDIRELKGLRAIVPFDIYIIYDDLELYDQLMKIL